MGNDSTISHVLCHLISVRSTAPTDIIVLNAVAFYPNVVILKTKNSNLSICMEKRITRKACSSHPIPSTEEIEDILDLIDRKPKTLTIPTFVSQGHTSMPLANF